MPVDGFRITGRSRLATVELTSRLRLAGLRPVGYGQLVHFVCEAKLRVFICAWTNRVSLLSLIVNATSLHKTEIKLYRSVIRIRHYKEHKFGQFYIKKRLWLGASLTVLNPSNTIAIHS